MFAEMGGRDGWGRGPNMTDRQLGENTFSPADFPCSLP